MHETVLKVENIVLTASGMIVGDGIVLQDGIIIYGRE